MAAKSLAGGELYFVGEKDPRTQQDTNFVKIGIVRDKDGRGTDHRVKEHQTGNPRLLHVVKIIPTPVVERIETAMRGLFAPCRLSGEWFYFAPSERDAAVDAAVSLIKQAKKHEAEMAEAESLKKEVSTPQVIPASPKLKKTHLHVVSLRAQLSACKDLSKGISDCMVAATKSGVDFGRLLSVQEKKAVERFSEDDFKAKYPKVWDKYLVTQESFSGPFRVVDPKAERPDPFELNTNLTDLAKRVEKAITKVTTKNSGADQLHELFLELLTVQAPLDWELMVTEDVVKSTIGTASEIEGLFKWTREKTLKESLDKDALREAEPKKFAEFITQSISKPAVVVARDRGFQIGK